MRRTVLLLLVVFAVTRGLMAWAAINPDPYLRGGAFITADVDNVFSQYAHELVDERQVPYRTINIEYPPGALPFLMAPEIARPDSASYRARFVVVMFVIDLAGVVGLARLARRWGSTLGLWVWIVGLFFLGPVVFLRLDLVPAVATIWAIERAAGRRWAGAGGWLGAGALAKLYPFALLPAALALAWRPRLRRFLITGFLAVLTVGLIPFVTSMGSVYRDVIAYQSARGIHIESTFGSLLMLARRFGYEATIESSHTTFHFVSGIAVLLGWLSRILSVAAVALATWLSFQAWARSDARRLADISFVTVALLVGVGNVFSPQYVLWIVAPAAASLCLPRSPIRIWVALVPLVALLTQLLYPFWYRYILDQNLGVLVLLTLRNGLVVAAGAGAAFALSRSGAGAGTEAGPTFWGSPQAAD